MRQQQPVELVYPDQGADGIGCFLVPNAVVLIAGAPHPDMAQKLIDYLLSKEVEAKLARSDAAQIPLHPGVEGPPELRPIDKLKTTQVNYAEIAAKLQAIQPFLKRWVELGIVTERLVLVAATLVLAAVGLLPVAAMLKETLIADGRFSLEAYRALLASERSACFADEPQPAARLPDGEPFNARSACPWASCSARRIFLGAAP